MEKENNNNNVADQVKLEEPASQYMLVKSMEDPSFEPTDIKPIVKQDLIFDEDGFILFNVLPPSLCKYCINETQRIGFEKKLIGISWKIMLYL